MADEIHANGMTISPSVINTIVDLAVKEVPGVDTFPITPSGIKALIMPDHSQSVKVVPEEDGSLAIEVTLHILDGYPVKELAAKVRSSVADAVSLQTGIPVSRVDIFIDGIRFSD